MFLSLIEKKEILPPCTFSPLQVNYTQAKLKAVGVSMSKVVAEKDIKERDHAAPLVGRPPLAYPHWAPKLLEMSAEFCRPVELGQLLGITREAVRLALLKHGIRSEVRFVPRCDSDRQGYYRGYYVTTDLHELARAAIAYEQDTKNSEIKRKEKLPSQKSDSTGGASM